jgi:hypothetical protein
VPRRLAPVCARWQRQPLLRDIAVIEALIGEFEDDCYGSAHAQFCGVIAL